MANDMRNFIIGCNRKNLIMRITYLAISDSILASNNLAHITGITTCYQQLRTQHSSPADKTQILQPTVKTVYLC